MFEFGQSPTYVLNSYFLAVVGIIMIAVVAAEIIIIISNFVMDKAKDKDKVMDKDMDKDKDKDKVMDKDKDKDKVIRRPSLSGRACWSLSVDYLSVQDPPLPLPCFTLINATFLRPLGKKESQAPAPAPQAPAPSSTSSGPQLHKLRPPAPNRPKKTVFDGRMDV